MVSKVSFGIDKNNLWAAFQRNNTSVANLQNNSASNNTANDKFVSSQIDKKEVKNYSKYILSALAGLAVIGVGIWYYIKRGRNPIKKAETPIQNPITTPNQSTNLSFKNIMSSFLSKFTKDDKYKVERAIEEQKLRRADCFKLLKNDEDILPLEQFFAVQNAKIENNLALPHIVEMPNLNSNNTSNIGKVFYKQFKTDFEKRTYISGDTKEFLSALQDFTAQKADNYTFMHIENFNEFLGDINKPENSSLLEAFKNLLSQNEKKKLGYLTSKVDEYENIPMKKLSLKFKDGVKTSDFALDLNHYDIMHTLKNTTETSQKIIDTMRKVLKVSRDKIGNIINGQYSFVLLKTPTSEYLNEFLNNLIKHTGYFSSNFDCASKKVSVIVNELEKILDNNLKISGRTGKINFVHIKNLEKVLSKCDINSAEYKKLSELLQMANEKYKTVFVAHSEQENSKIAELATKFGSIIKYDSPFDEKLFIRLKKEATERLNKTDWGNVNPKNIETDYLNDLILEKAGASMENCPILGGILLKGNNMADNDKVSNALISTFGDLINYKRIQYDSQNPAKSFSDLYDLAEKCGKKYAKTKKRTYIEVDNIDELMVCNIDDKLFELQAAFKSFVENCSKDNHVTILVKTTRNFDNLEQSCIGAQRFSKLYIDIKTRKD